MVSSASNVANRTIFEGDNLDIMRGFNSDSIDLIYLDPPFNSNRNYAAPIGSDAAGAAFKDTWKLSDVDNAWHGEIADREPAMYQIIAASELAHSKGMKSYLIMMAVRLIEIRRILKPTGSVYLHCDDSADYYLRMLMDTIFDASTWHATIQRKRTSAHNDKIFGRVMDTILVYGQPPKNKVMTELDPDYIERNYRYTDERGRFRTGDLTGAGESGGESGDDWHDYSPSKTGRHWAPPRTGKYATYIDRRFIPGYTSIKGVHDRLQALDDAGLIYWSRNGVPSIKRYLMPDQKQLASNIWTDCKDNQVTGYPTEKSLIALERIIKASSNEGDLVLDPFCGCATACIAAERLNRQWVGIDISPMAAMMVEKRAREELGMLGGIQTIRRTDIPIRTDVADIPNYRTQKHTLFGAQEGICNGCKIPFPFRNLTIDHIVPKSKGGTDHIENLQLLCSACNSMKGTKSQAEFLVALKAVGLGN